MYPGGKQLGPKTAVHSLTFSVHEGECFGFLGTNGAGKTTTLSMLSGKTVFYNFSALMSQVNGSTSNFTKPKTNNIEGRKKKENSGPERPMQC